MPALTRAVPPARSSDETIPPGGNAGRRRFAGRPAALEWALAPATWVLLVPVCLLVPGLAGIDPHTLRGAMVPVVAGGAALAVVGAVVAAGRLRPVVLRYVPALAAGVFAAWTVLLMGSALAGTPFGFNGLYGDMARMSAMATRYGATAWSADGIVADVASEYPILYPWLIGRASVLTGVPAWRLLDTAEILVTSFAVVAAFLLWRRLTAAPVALALAVAGFAVFHNPWKSYEVLALGVTVPWVLAAFAAPTRGRLHWVPAGVVGGLLLLTYQGYLMYGVLGLIGIVVWQWRAEAARWAYLAHVAKVSALALVLAAPYLGPYGGSLFQGAEPVADLYETWEIAANPFPFLEVSVPGLLQLAGLAGLVWYRRSAWWAPPLLALLLGSWAYRLVGAARYVVNGHTGMIHHAAVLTEYVLVAAAVLSLFNAVPALAGRLGVRRAAGMSALPVACLAVWTGTHCWIAWMPRTGEGAGAVQITRAYTEPLPGGGLPVGGDRRGREWFPVNKVRRAVEARLGEGARPRTLAYDERLFSYLPWNGYIAVDKSASGSATRWNSRFAELTALSRVHDPAAFASRSAATAFGPIDVFVLRAQRGAWVWRPLHHESSVRFRPAQFARSDFDVVEGLPGGSVVIVRKK